MVVDSPGHVVQRKSVQRVRKGRQFPRTDVPRQIQHSFPAPLPFQEIFMAIEYDNLFDIFFRVLRKPDKLRRHPTQIAQHSTNDFLSLGVAPLRKGNSQIDFRGFPQSRQQCIKNAHHSRSKTPRQRLRQDAQPLQNDPHGRVFNPFLHCVSELTRVCRRATVCKRSVAGR